MSEALYRMLSPGAWWGRKSKACEHAARRVVRQGPSRSLHAALFSLSFRMLPGVSLSGMVDLVS